MELDLDDVHREVRDRARRIARDELAPKAAELDRDERFPTESFRRLAEEGLLGLNVPSAHGGLDAGPIATALALREVAEACPSTAVGMSVTNMVAEMIARFGDETQRQRFVAPLVSGRAVAGAFCLSEPESGSDAASLRTTARPVEGGWILDGSKQWSTSANHAGVLVVMARTGAPDSGAKGISAFLLQADDEGLQPGRPEDKTGLRGSDTAPVTFDGCFVPTDRLLGEEGEGFRIAMTALDGGRMTIGAMACGIARAALDEAARYVGEAREEGSPLGETGSAAEAIADMRTELEASELMVLRAAWAKERSVASQRRGSGGRRFTREAAMAKLFATEHAQRVARRALGLMGPEGQRKDRPLERYLRDVRVTTIFEGTSEIQKFVIARDELSRIRG